MYMHHAWKISNFYLSVILHLVLILKSLYPFQLGIDIGSSTVARGVVSLVLGYLNHLVIEMAFLIQVKWSCSFPFLLIKFWAKIK